MRVDSKDRQWYTGYARIFWQGQEITTICLQADEESRQASVLISTRSLNPKPGTNIPIYLIDKDKSEPVTHVLQGDIRIEFSEEARKQIEWTRPHDGGDDWGQEVLDRIPKVKAEIPA